MPPAFVLSQNQTLQTKLFNHLCRWPFCSRIISCFLNSISIQFIYYDFKIYLRSQNLTGSSHYSIFKDHRSIFRSSSFIYHSLRFHQKAQRSYNLASLFRLSNQFSKIFQTFFTATWNQLAGFKRMRWNIAPNFYLSNPFLKIFQIFSCEHRFQLHPSEPSENVRRNLALFFDLSSPNSIFFEDFLSDPAPQPHSPRSFWSAWGRNIHHHLHLSTSIRKKVRFFSGTIPCSLHIDGERNNTD